MDFQELIRARYSCRAYRGDPVVEDQLVQVLEAARLAPTASNLQPFRLVVIRTAGREPVAFTPLGHPADAPRQKTRKKLEELVRYEKF